MASIERIKKYICPLCGTTGLKSERGLRKHMQLQHAGFTPEEFEAAWKASEAEFEARVPVEPGGQQKATQTSSVRNDKAGVRNSKPARKMVKFGANAVKTDTSSAPNAVKNTTSPPTPPKKEPKAPKPKAKPQHLKSVPTPPPDAPDPLTGVLSVPKGSQLMIDGDIYYQADAGFLPIKVERVAMTVGLRQASPDGRTWLFCKVDGVIYGLDERLVLSGAQQLVSLPPPVAVPDGPPTTECDVEEPPANVEYREKLPGFIATVTEYHAVKEQELAVSKLLKAARNEYYDHIYDFTMAHGSESAPNKLDFVLCEGGIRTWLQRTPGRRQTKYNEPAIIQWCLDNGREEVLCRALDVQAWAKLVESGVIPPSVTQLYTDVIDVPDTFRLVLTKEEGGE